MQSACASLFVSCGYKCIFESCAVLLFSLILIIVELLLNLPHNLFAHRRVIKFDIFCATFYAKHNADKKTLLYLLLKRYSLLAKIAQSVRPVGANVSIYDRALLNRSKIVLPNLTSWKHAASAFYFYQNSNRDLAFGTDNSLYVYVRSYIVCGAFRMRLSITWVGKCHKYKSIKVVAAALLSCRLWSCRVNERMKSFYLSFIAFAMANF